MTGLLIEMKIHVQCFLLIKIRGEILFNYRKYRYIKKKTYILNVPSSNDSSELEEEVFSLKFE